MLATVRGEINQIEDDAVIIETGGLGLRVFAPALLRALCREPAVRREFLMVGDIVTP